MQSDTRSFRIVTQLARVSVQILYHPIAVEIALLLSLPLYGMICLYGRQEHRKYWALSSETTTGAIREPRFIQKKDREWKCLPKLYFFTLCFKAPLGDSFLI